MFFSVVNHCALTVSGKLRFVDNAGGQRMVVNNHCQRTLVAVGGYLLVTAW